MLEVSMTYCRYSRQSLARLQSSQTLPSARTDSNFRRCWEVLERVAQIPLVIAGVYDTYNSESHGMNENYYARSHDRNSASANNSSDGGFRARI